LKRIIAIILILFFSIPSFSFDGLYLVAFTDPEGIRKREPLPEEIMIQEINLCKESFYGAFYDISSIPFAKALISAKKRGVEVLLVTDSDNFSGKAIEMIVEAGIPVVTDERTALMHNKFAIIDKEIIWTGSTNVTENCFKRNNNNSIFIKSHELAEIYRAEFEEMFIHGVFGNKKEYGAFASVRNKYYVRLGDTNINVYFSPENNVERIIDERLKKAKKSIRFMAFSFTSDKIGETMIEKYKSGVIVEGVFEKRGTKSEHSEFTKMLIEGVPVVADGNKKIMHHKVIIIDDYRVITGSFNFSENADKKNDENILIIDDEAVAKIYLKEFQRVYQRGKDGRKHGR